MCSGVIGEKRFGAINMRDSLPLEQVIGSEMQSDCNLFTDGSKNDLIVFD